MKCSSRFLCGLLISCLAVRGSYEELFVDQSPSNITVKEGDSTQIRCCWNQTQKSYKVAWHKNEQQIPVEKQQYQIIKTENCSVLKIINVVHNDTGDYVCKVNVDIPVLTVYEGAKTVLNVTEVQSCTTQTTTHGTITNNSTTLTQTSPEKNDKPLPILPLSLAASMGLVTLCLVLSLCKMRNSCKKTERVVIHQTPHSEGEEHEHMEEEEGSTGSSRGSLQWYQVPVYWSYFDLQKGEEQCQ